LLSGENVAMRIGVFFGGGGGCSFATSCSSTLRAQPPIASKQTATNNGRCP
jgi:hypothetical protein